MSKIAEATFDEHEKPTAPHDRPITDPNATTRMAKVDLDELVRKESGTRRALTAEQIDAYVREKTKSETSEDELEGPPVQVRTVILAPSDVQMTAQQIPIDIDLTAMRQGVDQRRLIALVAVIAVVLAALAGFIVGRMSL